MKTRFCLLVAALLALASHACIWDADSLGHEKTRSHDLAAAILGEPPPPDDPQKLQARINDLQTRRDEASAEWWNNLAGAYLRLNQPVQAAKILAPVAEKFPNDYGIHANLGTAYHLLGRYTEAEKEIAHDLEINPNAHFGLEKYHLALLQYLARDTNYQSRHVYVDEFTASFLESRNGRFHLSDANERVFRQMAEDFTNNLAAAEAEYALFKSSHPPESEAMEMLGTVAVLDQTPSYRTNWNLAADTNFEAGVIYMAQMNPQAPASFEMLGIAAWEKRNYHLAVSAFKKAIALGSPKSDVLTMKIAGLNDYIRKSSENTLLGPGSLSFGLLCLIPILVGYYFYTKFRDRQRKLAGQK